MPSTPDSARVQNKLLTALPKDELERFLPDLQPIHLEKSEILNVAGDAVEYAYFPNNGMISLLSTTASGASIEVAMVGQEGMVGIPLVLRLNIMPYESVIQITSDGLKVRSALLVKESRGRSDCSSLSFATHMCCSRRFRNQPFATAFTLSRSVSAVGCWLPATELIRIILI